MVFSVCLVSLFFLSHCYLNPYTRKIRRLTPFALRRYVLSLKKELYIRTKVYVGCRRLKRYKLFVPRRLYKKKNIIKRPNGRT